MGNESKPVPLALLRNIEATWREASAFSNTANQLIETGLPELRALLAAPVQPRGKCCTPTAEEEALLAAGDYTPEELWGGSKPSCPNCIGAVPPQADAEPATFTLTEPVAPWFYFVECDDPDYSGLFNNESEAQTQANDHGGEVVKLWNVPPTYTRADTHEALKDRHEAWIGGVAQGKAEALSEFEAQRLRADTVEAERDKFKLAAADVEWMMGDRDRLNEELAAAEQRIAEQASMLEEMATEMTLAISDSQIRASMTSVGRTRFFQLLQTHNARFEAALSTASPCGHAGAVTSQGNCMVCGATAPPATINQKGEGE